MVILLGISEPSRTVSLRSLAKAQPLVDHDRSQQGTDPVPFPMIVRGSKIITRGEPARENVRVASLRATQPKVFPARVAEYSASYGAQRYVRPVILLALPNGEHAIWDGHHRAAGAKLAGVERIFALVFHDHEGLG